jgi:HSP20 family molecular chaperone IbpA
MWAQACEMLDRAERLQRQFYQPGRRARGVVAWQPPMDLLETEEEFWIVMALPGVDPAGVSVILDGGQLVVNGERRLPAGAGHAHVHRLEIPHGRFERRVPLPAVPLQLRGREFVNGCLYIVLSK